MDYKKAYIDFLRKYIRVERPLTVVFDASNGPAGMLMKDLWAATPVHAIIINDAIDPDFKAHGPNPLVPGASDDCAKAIRDNNADLGVMFDADADRALFIDNTGAIVPACFVAALIFKESKPPYVADELIYQSLKILKIIPEKDIIPSRIGAYFIKEQMRDKAASAGGEYSGHYFFKDFFNADSGIFAAITVLNCLSKIHVSFSEWKSQFGEHTIITKEIKTEGKDMAKLYAYIEEKYVPKAKHLDKRDGLTFVFDSYFINVRSSNTEPIMRIIAGGSGAMQETAKQIEADIGNG